MHVFSYTVFVQFLRFLVLDFGLIHYNSDPFNSLSPPSGKLTKHVSDISISNGMDWSLANKTMYFIDSAPRNVYAFDYNEHQGTVEKQRLLIDFTQDNTLGFPDGMCIDAEGRLWIAGFLGSCISCWDPADGKMLRNIKIPARRTTSCCFGGPNLEWLFVTSASLGAREWEWSKFPHSGGIFVVKGLGVRGRPGNRFRYNLQSMV